MGVFVFVILLVLISTVGKVILARSHRPHLPPGMRPQDIQQLNETVSDLSTRLSKLEEERDFYQALLESPERKTLRRPPSDEGDPE